MMYSRLKLARNLLTDDGVILISINDVEQSNLSRISSEIFGELNFIGQFVWHNASRVSDTISNEHEYIICYAKDLNRINNWKLSRPEATKLENLIQNLKLRGVSLEDAQKELKSEIDKYLDIDKNKKTKKYSWLNNYSNLDDNWNIYYAVDLTGEGAGPARKFGEKIIPAPTGRHWMGQEYIDELYKNNRIVWRGDRAYRKLFINESMDNLKSIISIPTRQGSELIKKILGKDVFDKSKPVNLIKHLASYILKDQDIFMDFFAGSGTSAQAIMELNMESLDKKIRYILIQYPEKLSEGNKSDKAPYAFCIKNNLRPTIAEISKERIRRVSNKILEDNVNKEGIENLDIGFRVLKIDSTNMKDVYYTPDAVKQADMLDLASNIKEDRISEDLLFQVMLDWGLELSLPIERKIVAGKEVFFVAGNSLVACFNDLTFDVVDEVAKDHPLRFVSAEKAIHLDHDKTNIKERFKQLSPDTEVKFL